MLLSKGGCQPCLSGPFQRCSSWHVATFPYAKKPISWSPKRLRPLANGFLDDDIKAHSPLNPSKDLINPDFAPTPASARTWSATDMATFWITLVISIPTYMLAASLMDLGMVCVCVCVCVLLGNSITLLPMQLNGHPGVKFGVPFPVLSRSSFGIVGANVPSITRALVACGWFGIQTWVGGNCIYQILALLDSAGWAVKTAGGFGPMLSAPSLFSPGMPKAGQFWGVFWPAVTAQVSFWGTLCLNIPDFTRYAYNQRAQWLGQAIGLPLTMVLFTFLGVAVTSASAVIYGAPITDPVQLLGKMEGTLPICLSLFGLTAATLTTNVAANIVAPANAFINVSPKNITFQAGALLTASLGAVIQPWKLVSSTSSFISTWLCGYSVFLGPVIGIILSDYYIVRKRELDLDSLYQQGELSAYWYKGGWNPAALAALAAGVLPCLPGLLQQTNTLTGLPPFWGALYSCAWFIGVTVSSLVYVMLMAAPGKQKSSSQASAY
ncbi:permease for cytosine/purines, uracil, thiamine, allantoin-domain-containing protein [Dunaliella salina]|uniref:Permease for cytosine/purines, uracil, thiamine, allantoin-domain-containing protein n=1 Tax=Dunaliella salina TaxID=3046 RepID=A0ABQ7FZT2_DUNSA|nr:permease for cytosine/purines, uracil, thiamine, allantoin-domain-containing protein [Dunaliella salina]|eukprot:KAF5827855.1 permease for cytosine/purines, uracil, thiamine, allantoin-domain-containing protein [Dunaliella salina]